MSCVRLRASERWLHLLSGTNLLQPPRLNPVQRSENRGDERKEILHTIGPRHDKHDAEWQHRDVLFTLEFSIHRDEGIDLAARPLQKKAAVHARPPPAL